MSTSSDVPEAVSPSQSTEEASPPPQKKLPPGLRPYAKFELPTAEQMAAEESMNNCAVRTVLSLFMGAGLGAMFGVFMGTMDGAVSGSERECVQGECDGLSCGGAGLAARHLIKLLISSGRRAWTLMAAWPAISPSRTCGRL